MEPWTAEDERHYVALEIQAHELWGAVDDQFSNAAVGDPWDLGLDEEEEGVEEGEGGDEDLFVAEDVEQDERGKSDDVADPNAADAAAGTPAAPHHPTQGRRRCRPSGACRCSRRCYRFGSACSRSRSSRIGS